MQVIEQLAAEALTLAAVACRPAVLDDCTLLAESEGIFCEPASAASVAGFRQLWDAGYFREVPEAEREVVCILTGHGLKDPNTALHAIKEPVPIQPTLDAVLAAIGI